MWDRAQFGFQKRSERAVCPKRDPLMRQVHQHWITYYEARKTRSVVCNALVPILERRLFTM